jgi:mannosyl-oligosaccharide alpha-1,2-mannosidase
MSFAVPRNVPNFDTAQRRFEDNVWNKFTGAGEKGLPMYKDKPAYYGSRNLARTWFRGKRGAAVVVVGVLALLYWVGLFSGGSSTRTDAREKSGTSWGGIISAGRGGRKGAVDWEQRREAVKDAFLLSWKAYEDHGWGWFICGLE